MVKKETKTIFDSSPAKLSQLLKDADENERNWNSDDLKALFRHQMATPVPLDFDKFSRKNREKVKLLVKSHGLLLNSYQDLFTHVNPPLELLKMVKEFAKQCLSSPNAVLPREIVSVLYYLSIFTADLKKQEKITKLSDDELQQGLDWCLSQTWLTDDIRQIFEDAQKQLKGRG